MTVNLLLAPTFGVGYQLLSSAGEPISGGMIYTYASGSTTKVATYADICGLAQNANPIVVGADGRPPWEIWIVGGINYKFVLCDNLGNTIATYDNVYGIGSSISAVAQYANVVSFGADPSGVSDSTASIQACIDYAGASGVTMYVPVGTYKVIPSYYWLTENNNGGGFSDKYALWLRSNLRIVADEGATFRVADNVFSPYTNIVGMAMFATNESLHDISIKNLTMDMNGANNSPMIITTANITAAPHALVVLPDIGGLPYISSGSAITFTGGSLPDGLSANTVYYASRLPATITKASPCVITDAQTPNYKPPIGSMIVFYANDPIPAPLITGTIYHVVGTSGYGFTISATHGGTAINITSGSGDPWRVYYIVDTTATFSIANYLKAFNILTFPYAGFAPVDTTGSAGVSIPATYLDANLSLDGFPQNHISVRGGSDVVRNTATVTIASPAVVTDSTGYAPMIGSSVVLTTTGSLPTGLTAGTLYYVVGYSGAGFTISATQAGTAINTSGTQSGVHSVGHVAYINDMKIDGCRFINSPGTCCIAYSQTNQSGDVTGNRWTIQDCVFYNNGNYSLDNSQVTGSGMNGMLISGCYFYTDTANALGNNPNGFGWGARMAMELHGRNIIVQENVIQGLYYMGWITPASNGGPNDIIVSGNVCNYVSGGGILFMSDAADAGSAANIIVSNNTFHITDIGNSTAGFVACKVGVEISDSYGINDISVIGNTVTKDGTVIGGGICSVISESVAGQKHNRIVIKDNVGKNISCGVFIVAQSADIGTIIVANNDFLNLSQAGVFHTDYPSSGSYPVCGIYINPQRTATIDAVIAQCNRTIDTRGASSESAWGLYVDSYAATASTLSLLCNDRNISVGMKSGGWKVVPISNVSISRLVGKFDAIPFTPVWKGGSTTIAPGTGGSSLGFYSIDGDMITVSATLKIGTSPTLGAGVVSMILPLSSSSASTGSHFVGSWRILDGVNNEVYFGNVIIDGTAQIAQLQLQTGTPSNFQVTTSAPIALAATDVISIQITYPQSESY